MKSNYTRLFSLHCACKKMFHCLESLNVARIEILFDFIAIFSQSYRYSIMAFVNVFVNIFDYLHICRNLKVDVTIIFADQAYVVRDNMTVIEKKSIFFKTLTIVAMLVQRNPLYSYSNIFWKAWKNIWCINHVC